MDSTAARPVAHTLIISVEAHAQEGLAVVGARALPGDYLATLALRLEAAALDLTGRENSAPSGYLAGLKAGLRLAADILEEGAAR